MSPEPVPDTLALREAFDHDIYSSSGNPLKFGSLFYDCDVYPAEKKILVIFIRHFFCGNCQEYVRRLSSADSPFHPSHKAASTTWTTNFSKPATRTLPTVVIIGPGQPSLIASYKTLTQCPFDIYADPSTNLYKVLGMYRTLSMGSRSPGYIEHSLLSGAVKSAWQIVRRVGSGDAMAGGDWDVNGGEYLFTRSATRSRAGSRSPSRSRSRSRSANAWASSSLDWEVSWCHRMVNSRDHAELVDLAYRTCFATQPSTPAEDNLRTSSPAPPLKSILVNGGKTHTRTVSRGYSSDRVGSCPGPDIPKSRSEVPADPHHSRTHSRSQSKSKSPRRLRSRSTSVGSRKTAKQNHERVWSNVSSAEASRSESPPSTALALESVDNTISEAEEEEVKPRKSFTASVAEAIGVRSMLKRSGSVSGASNAVETAPSLPRPSISISDLRSASRASSAPNAAKPRSKTISGPLAHLRTKSKSKLQPAEGTSSQDSDAVPPSQSRNRAFSLSKSPHKHRPSLSLTRKSSGAVEMDETGVMFVNGVEFVNVISVKARVDSKEEEQRRRLLRERADSGLGMGIEDAVMGGKGEATPPVPVPPPVAGQGRAKKKYSSLTALPEIGAVH